MITPIVSASLGRINLSSMLSRSDDIDQAEGATAYHKYNRLLSDIAHSYGYDFHRVVAAFCALSPNNDYYGNLRSLVSVLLGLDCGVPVDKIVISTYNHCRDRAAKYLTGEEEFDVKSRGLKIRSFYHNIISPDSPDWVTIDGHIAAAYQGDDNLTMKEVILTKKNYMVISQVLFSMSEEQGVLPNQLQAQLWFTRKRTCNVKYVPVRDMFSDADDFWRIMVPVQDITPYPRRAI